MLNRFQRLLKILKWKVIHAGHRRDITLDTWNGLLTCDTKDWLIGKYLFVNGSYEQDNILQTLSFLKSESILREGKGDVVLDVGANIGMIAIALLKHSYFERAAAFEPDPNNYRLLLRNVTQNDFAYRILTFPLGLSSSVLAGDAQGSEAMLERSPDNFGDHRIRRSNESGFFREEGRSTVPVKLKSLDQVLADSRALKAEDIDLIWVDIQGHEGHFFSGARTLLQHQIPVVSEFWPYAILRSGMSREEYLQIVEDLFTDFFVLKGNHFQKKPIAELGSLFDRYKSPRSGTQVILIRRN